MFGEEWSGRDLTNLIFYFYFCWSMRDEPRASHLLVKHLSHGPSPLVCIFVCLVNFAQSGLELVILLLLSPKKLTSMPPHLAWRTWSLVPPIPCNLEQGLSSITKMSPELWMFGALKSRYWESVVQKQGFHWLIFKIMGLQF
jgi:hypothetical protein